MSNLPSCLKSNQFWGNAIILKSLTMSFPWDLEHKNHFTVWITEHFATRHKKIESRQMGCRFFS